MTRKQPPGLHKTPVTGIQIGPNKEPPNKEDTNAGMTNNHAATEGGEGQPLTVSQTTINRAPREEAEAIADTKGLLKESKPSDKLE